MACPCHGAAGKQGPPPPPTYIPTITAATLQSSTPPIAPETPYDPCKPFTIAAPQRVGYPCPVLGAAPTLDACPPRPLVNEDPCRPSPNITYKVPTHRRCEPIRPRECSPEIAAIVGRKIPCLLDSCNRLDYGPVLDQQLQQMPCLINPPYDPYSQQVPGATYVARPPRDICSPPPKPTSESYDPCSPPAKLTYPYPPCGTTKTTYGAAYNNCGFSSKSINPGGYVTSPDGQKTSAAMPAKQGYVMPGQTPPEDPCLTNVGNKIQGYVQRRDPCVQPLNDPCGSGKAGMGGKRPCDP